MSGLLDDIKAEQTPMKGPRCTVGAMLKKMPPVEAVDLLAALADDTIATTAIVRVLSRRGYQMKAHTLNRHRVKGCRCE